MSNQGKIFIVTLFIFGITSCNMNTSSRDIDYYQTSKKIVKSEKYDKIFCLAKDSIKVWGVNKLGNFAFQGKGKNFILDSLLCFSKDGNRLIGAILNINLSNPTSDGIDYFYGEKINKQWFFFRGAYIVIPRNMVKGHLINQPLSYQQLHQIALKDVYGGYLNKQGEINEAWFIDHFENGGWGNFEDQASSDEYLNLKGKRFTNKRAFFEAIHLQSVKNNWYGINKDSIKQLPTKTNLP